jgi:hypothetical protein
MRRLFGFVALLSLLLWVVTLLAWLSSYNVHERYVWHSGRDSWGLVTYDGLLQLKQMQKEQGYGFEEGYRLTGHRATGHWERGGVPLRSMKLPGLGWEYGGILFQGSTFGAPPPRFAWFYQSYYFFYWLPFLLTTLIPAIWLFQFSRRRSKLNPGRCHVCQYDLRASAERCPECGTAVSERPSLRWCPDIIASRARKIVTYVRRF